MAVTSIWRVHGYLGDVVLYAENPEKTDNPAFFKSDKDDEASLQNLNDVIEYAASENKTGMKDEESQTLLKRFVSGINCEPQTARDEMMAVKKRFGKMDGVIAYHGYQSFGPGEATPETAHEIGIRLAEKLWGDRYQVLVTTHLDKQNHLHNHFVLNTVSFKDGIKYHRTDQDYRDMQKASDELCREYSLSVIEEPVGKRKNYGLYRAEKNGKPTRASIIRKDIDRAILASTTESGFFKVMEEMGYTIRTVGASGNKLKHATVQPYGSERRYRFDRLGPEYTPEEIVQRIGENIRKHDPFPEAERQFRQYHLRGSLKDAKKITGIYALYIHYCYALKIITRRPAQVKRVSFLMRADVTKMDRIFSETKFLARTGIKTVEQLKEYQSRNQSKIDSLILERKDLRNQLKRELRQENDSRVAEEKSKISDISGELKELRKEVRLCVDIEQRSAGMKVNLEQLNRERENERKEKSENEQFRRSGRTGRENVT